MDSPTTRTATPDEIEERHERAGMYLAALALFTVPILIIGAMVSTRTSEPEAAAPLEPATRSGLESLEIEASEITIDEPSVTNPDSNSISNDETAAVDPATDSAVDQAADQAAEQAAEQLPSIPADAITVAAYNEATDEPGTLSFAIRLTSTPESPEIGTGVFTIAVVGDTGIAVPTISRFEHDSLPSGSSALALVRAENVGPGDHYVVVRVGDTELSRAVVQAAD